MSKVQESLRENAKQREEHAGLASLSHADRLCARYKNTYVCNKCIGHRTHLLKICHKKPDRPI